jgi:hypothetical protein
LFLKKALLIVLPVLLLFLSACSEFPTSIGADLLKDDYIGISELNSASDTLLQSTSYFKVAQPLGAADRLLIGKVGDMEAGSLIKFNIAFVDSMKEAIKAGKIVIKSANMVLYKTYAFGDTNSTSPDFHAYEATTSWSPLTFTVDNLSSLGHNSQNLISDLKMDSTIAHCTLDKSIVLSWFKYAADTNNTVNNGLYLKPSGNGTIMGFQSLSSYVDTVQVPRLWIVYEKTGSYTDTITIYPEGDLSFVTRSETIPGIPSEDIIVQAGVTVNSLLKFDLSRIPAHSIVNSAELIVTADSIHTLRGTSYTDKLVAARLIDAAKKDSVTNYCTLEKSNGKYSGNITSIIQNIYTSMQSGGTNNGIVLRAYDQLNGVEQFAIKGFGASEAERPYLKITYTIKK